MLVMEEERMTQYNQEQAEREFTRPWSERRGIETIYRNGVVILVKAPLDNLSEVLAKRAIEVRRDVFGSEIEVSGVFMFASQLVGHPWSILLHDQVIEPNRFSRPIPDAAQLSKELKQSVIS